MKSPHPITGTSHRFSLDDRFHRGNQKRPEEKLRSLDLLPELTGILNSSMAEQLNKELSNSRCFPCQLKVMLYMFMLYMFMLYMFMLYMSMLYMFMLRLVFHFHNQRVNNTFFEKMCRLAKGKAAIGINGRICLFGHDGEQPEDDTEDVATEVPDETALSDADIPFPEEVTERG
ncbi:hypothetical protein NHX12_002168 [Muraenolepis orangiensis]|uniref:Uncharacterized protein n=1 Tax=Muraenolepis orangiensis TaxID=630683 RepID=A0A9Q0IHY3_9TELE|nr:hypothetical protein NHX12_002168 [Muraenolepis orangiensis]